MCVCVFLCEYILLTSQKIHSWMPSQKTETHTCIVGHIKHEEVMPQNLEAKGCLQGAFTEHTTSIGCWNCEAKEGLQVAHLFPGKKLNPRKNVYYIVEPQREAHAEKLMAELRGCGILCRSCHRQYDAHERYGHPKVAWDAKFKAGGVAAANWEQWKREYLCLSQDLQMMIKEAEA